MNINVNDRLRGWQIAPIPFLWKTELQVALFSVMNSSPQSLGIFFLFCFFKGKAEKREKGSGECWTVSINDDLIIEV